MDISLNFELDTLREIDSGRVPGGIYDIEESGAGRFFESLYEKGFIDGKLTKGFALVPRGLTELGKRRLLTLEQNNYR